MVGPIDVKQKGNENQLDAALTGVPLTLTFDFEFWRSNCISGMGGPIVMERKGRELMGCPDVKHFRKWVNWLLRWLGYLWPWILKVKLYFRNGKPDCYGTKGWESIGLPWCETQPLCDLEAEDTVRDRGDLRCRRFRWLVLFVVIFCTLCWFAVVDGSLQRATLDLNLRHINLEKKTTHDQHMRKSREKDRDLRNLKKAELHLKVAEDNLNHTIQISEKVKGQVCVADSCKSNVHYVDYRTTISTI